MGKSFWDQRFFLKKRLSYPKKFVIIDVYEYLNRNRSISVVLLYGSNMNDHE